MAANPTTEQRATEQHARKITTYDLIIGILAIFSLILLIPIYFGNLSSQDKTVLIILEDALCAVFLFDFFLSLRLASLECYPAISRPPLFPVREAGKRKYS